MITAARPIATIEELRDHLQYAIGIELTTIPAYLCALYSLEDATNTAAAEVLQSVVLEEMLHMALAANVLNAIGGTPSTAPVGDGPSPVPTYPSTVPFIDRIPVIHLQSFSREAIDAFLAIEFPDQPDQHGEPDQPVVGSQARGGESKDAPQQYASIGAFYAAIEDGLQRLANANAFAEGRRRRGHCQIPATSYYGGAGSLIEVRDLDSALVALSAIVREGEGAPVHTLTRTAADHLVDGAAAPGRTPAGYSVDDLDRMSFGWRMYSHYARFSELRAGRRYRPDQHIDEMPAGDLLPVNWRSIYLMDADPTAAQFSGTPVEHELEALNRLYTSLVDNLYDSFNGDRGALDRAVPIMYELKYSAQRLFRMPSPHNESRRVGPSFEYLLRP